MKTELENMPSPQLRVGRVAGLLGVSERSITRLVKRGKLPAYRIGSQLRFDPDEVAAFLRAARIDATRA